MRTSTKIIAASSALVVLGGLTAAGVSLADSRYGRHHGEHHGDGMGYRGMHDDDHGSRMGRHMAGMFEIFDTDADGKLTQAEIDQVRAKRLAAFDADNDGRLSLGEYQALWLDAMRERMVDRFQAHDDDGDGFVTAAEFGQPYDRMVVRMDRNGDGVLNRDDMGRHRRDRDDDEDDD